RVGPWAQRTQPGDTIVISQCGSPKLITNGISRVLAGADLTSFPALAAGLETLPEKVQVEAFVEIPGPEDEQPADLPAGISINWIIKPDPHAPSDDLISALRNAPAPDEETSVFVAGEFSTVADLRQHFRRDLGVDKHRLYISSYWKAGLEEPDHAAAKAVSVS
ncbi:MAG: siderophore-interacting protein, partial [Pseudomonadota bacterium]